jgi:hypothetical protein
MNATNSRRERLAKRRREITPIVRRQIARMQRRRNARRRRRRLIAVSAAALLLVAVTIRRRARARRERSQLVLLDGDIFDAAIEEELSASAAAEASSRRLRSSLATLDPRVRASLLARWRAAARQRRFPFRRDRERAAGGSGAVMVLAATFHDEQHAREALEGFAGPARNGATANAAILRRDASGKLHLTAGSGDNAALHVVIDAAIGDVGGSALVVPDGIDSLMKRLATELRDSGFDHDAFARISDRLPPDGAAVVAVIDTSDATSLHAHLGPRSQSLVMQPIAGALVRRREPAHELAYATLVAQVGAAPDPTRPSAATSGFEPGTVIGEDEQTGIEFVARQQGIAVRPRMSGATRA